MVAYYNEYDPKAAAWLRELIAQGHIAHGDVDERSIEDVRPDDLRHYTQCHFFAGIGVWSYALRNAGWSDDTPVWTGSCPCQPFSASGKRKGTDDHRHLWPTWFRLIRECRPDICFGEQVASKDGLGWLDIVSTDLENAGYAVGAVDTCAAGVGAPHIRQRLYFVADACAGGFRINGRSTGGDGRHSDECRPPSVLADDDSQRRDRGGASRIYERRSRAGGGLSAEGEPNGSRGNDADGRGTARDMADTDAGRFGIDGAEGKERVSRPHIAHADERGEAGVVGNTSIARLQGSEQRDARYNDGHRPQAYGPIGEPSAAFGFWSDAEWIACRDGKARPVEPGTFPLAHGAPARVGRLRGYGNAIVAPQAQAFIEAYLEIMNELR